VARRAFQAAAAGRPGAFFYVRRFASRTGGRDVYVAVTCRLTAGGAGSPLALTDVRVAFDAQTPVVALEQGTMAPPLYAEITYTGAGRLQGRWEVALPGEELPTDVDLLPEASLPLEQRGVQRRFKQLERFNVFLPPTGRTRIPGPDPSLLPRDVDGTYLVLFRVEASDDRDSESDLGAAGAGVGTVSSGAVAGFAMPTLRYVVGSGIASEPRGDERLMLLQPANGVVERGPRLPTFAWEAVPLASRYRLEIERPDGTPVFDALVASTIAAYRPPPVFAERAGTDAVRWRVRAQDAGGREIARSAWRPLTLGSP